MPSIYDLPLPKYFDKQQMWHALELLNKDSYTLTAELQRTMHDAWRVVRQAGMSDLDYPRQVETKLPEPLQHMPQIERAIALIVSQKI